MVITKSRFTEMLKHGSIFLLMAAVLGACTDDDVVVQDNQDDRMVTVTISAGFDEQGGTRTAIAATGDNHWKLDDEIGVWPLGANGIVEVDAPYKFKVTTVKTDQTKCTLTGQMPAKYAESKLAAIYPYQAEATLEKIDYYEVPYVDDGGQFTSLADNNYKYLLTANIPRVQKAVKGSYDPDAYISMAVMAEAGEDLNFKNACMLIKFTAPQNSGKTITAFKLESRNETDLDVAVNDLTGKFQIAYMTDPSNYEVPAGYNKLETATVNSILIANMNAVGSNSNDVILEAPDGFEPGAEYYVVVKSFISGMYKQGGTLPSTGGGNWVESWLGNDYQVWDKDMDVEDLLGAYGLDVQPASTRMDDVVINVIKGSPMLKSGHILSFTASDGTVCTRKFKASKTEEEVSAEYKVIPLPYNDSGTNYWYWVTKKTKTTTSGHNFVRSTYMSLTFSDTPSNWEGKFVAP